MNIKYSARSKLPKKRRRVLPVEQPRRKKVENATNRRMNAIKHHHPAVFKDAFGGAKLGNVNGVNVIGLALQGPSVPSIAVLHHNGPYNLQVDAPPIPSVSSILPLQPRPATTGSVDALPLQPRYLPVFDRESRSEPRDISPKPESSPLRTTETEIGLASVPAMAIGSSTEVLVSIVENQAGLRRGSFLFGGGRRSPECEAVKSPSTELTCTSEEQSTPVVEDAKEGTEGG